MSRLTTKLDGDELRQAVIELTSTNAELEQRLARTNAELKQRLAERTIERDDVARDEALTELARTNAELKQRLAERTIERDDVARDEAITEWLAQMQKFKQRPASGDRADDAARDEAQTELVRTNMAQVAAEESGRAETVFLGAMSHARSTRR